MTEEAFRQIRLLELNDFTLNGKIFRIKITGKECFGFTYSIGFTETDPLDVEIIVTQNEETVKVYMDPFTAYYTQRSQLDYVLNLEEGQEGFELKNLDQDKYRGKFFKNPEMTPPEDFYERT